MLEVPTNGITEIIEKVAKLLGISLERDPEQIT